MPQIEALRVEVGENSSSHEDNVPLIQLLHKICRGKEVQKDTIPRASDIPSQIIKEGLGFSIKTHRGKKIALFDSIYQAKPLAIF